MAITITKQKTEAKPAPKVEEDYAQALQDKTKLTMEDLADIYGTLNDRATAIMQNEVFTQLSEVSKELNTRLDSDETIAPTDTVEITGKHWILEVGACSKNAAKMANVEVIRTMLGEKTFMQLCKVSITDLKKYLTPEQQLKALDTDTGYKKGRTFLPKFLG